MSIRLTKEQADHLLQTVMSSGGDSRDRYTTVLREAERMGIVRPVEDEPTSSTESDNKADLKVLWGVVNAIRSKVAALEAKANRPASEPFVVTDHADKKERARLWDIGIAESDRSGLPRLMWVSKTHRWYPLPQEWSPRPLNTLHGDFGTEVEAWANFPTTPPPGYVVPKPDQKPTSSLIEACAEAARQEWHARTDAEDWKRVATAAITRFLEEPVSNDDIESCFNAYMRSSGGDYQGVRYAIDHFLLLLLDRVKGGV